MKSLSCKDMGATSCDFVATGETDEEVIGKMKAHAASDHAEDMAKMVAMGEEGMTNMMKSHIKTV